ncbi:NUDIX hydrolase [Priestia koreensis]|uniref:Nudix hydrolase domain-containing protein n=1 Tax=Priestia koreensis TaxID=284581 RepID=A0A0M0L644_9BACI|nr:NUDIX hydrolase [Priestia koreensis]KOO46143.1 hypothetical protein AMD01_09760 [Priestia koreensis]
MSADYNRRLGVYAICEKDGKLLVVDKRTGPYRGRIDLPGGGVESFETIEEALKREIREETGLNVIESVRLGMSDFLLPFSAEETGYHMAIMYHLLSWEGSVTPVANQFSGQDADGARWVHPDDIKVETASPLVIEAMKWLKTGSLTDHTTVFDHWTIHSKTTQHDTF